MQCTKPVRRWFKIRASHRPVVVTLDPKGEILFREKAKRTEFALDVGHAFVYAIRLAMTGKPNRRNKP